MIYNKRLSNEVFSVTLTNRSSNITQTPTLFKFSSDSVNGVFESDLLRVTVLDSYFTGGNFVLDYGAGTYSIVAPSNFNDLITDLNNEFQEDGRGIFTYQFVEGSGNILLVSSSVYTMVSLKTPSAIAKPFIDTGFDTLIGTAVSLSIDGSVTYSELISELSNQPYELINVTVDAGSSSQVNSNFVLNDRKVSGLIDKNLKYTRLDPMQNQNYILNYPLGFLTSHLNKLEYSVYGGETVTLIFEYRYLNANEISNVTDQSTIKNKLEQAIQEHQNQNNMNSEFTNPLFTLIESPSAQKSSSNIKEVVENLEKYEMKDPEEVWTSFNGYDFKEGE